MDNSHTVQFKRKMVDGLKTRDIQINQRKSNYCIDWILSCAKKFW